VQEFVRRHPVWSLIIAIVVAVLLWLIFAPWSDGLEEVLGRKRVFLNAVFGGSRSARSTSSWRRGSR
jgi:branched-chain amino acid transport system permease protein